MLTRITLSLAHLVVLLISFECIVPAFISDGGDHIAVEKNINPTPQKGLFFSSYLETAEESEWERDRIKFLPVEIADFSKLKIHLSKVHTLLIDRIHLELHYDPLPPLFKRFCVFII